MEMTGAQILIESLRRQGVDTIFGMPGGVVLGIYDLLYEATDIRHILTRHEQVATHAADGYARASGKPGTVLVTSGPGATNTVTGLATAYMDSIPIVVITGQVPTNMIGNDAFQEADIVGISRPCTKHNVLVKDVNLLAQTITDAYYIASSGCPGPVLVDLPKDVTTAVVKNPVFPKTHQLPGYKPQVHYDEKALANAIDLLRESKRPVIYAGGGINSANAASYLHKFATSLGIPVTTTITGLGGFPEDHELSLGMLGMHGTWYANMAMHEADCILALGSRFDDRVTGNIKSFAPNASFVHVDINPCNINKNVRAQIGIVGDIKEVLKGFNQSVKSKDLTKRKSWATWRKRVTQWKKEKPLTYKHSDEVIKPQFLVEQISDITGGKAIICTGVGQHQMWAAQFYKFTRPRTILSSGGLGTMGYGFPSAIGAQIAKPKDLVFVIDGDGSFEMTHQDLITAVNNNLPIKVAIFNNGYLGMVRQWQQLFFKKRYSQSDIVLKPDFVKLAEASGAVGLRATKPKDVKKVLQKALSVKNVPVVMDFHVDREENVFPMVPAGGGAKDMMLA
jgi:acetolactate synthase-1/2/3 large subunit